MQHSRKAAIGAAIAGIVVYLVAFNVLYRVAHALFFTSGAYLWALLLCYPLALVVAAIAALKVRDRL